MKRASMNSHQSHYIDEEAMARLKHQDLLEEYLELQKEYVSRKRKLRSVQQKKEILYAEVRFLRQRHKHLSKKGIETEQDQAKLRAPYAPNRRLLKDRSYDVNEVVFKKPSLFQDSNPTSDDRENDGRSREKRVSKSKRVVKKKAGKKNMAWEDNASLEV